MWGTVGEGGVCVRGEASSPGLMLCTHFRTGDRMDVVASTSTILLDLRSFSTENLLHF
jgi:hypothetical protein